MIVVADTSPLTAILHLRQLSLLEILYGEIYIPFTVAEELQTLIQFGYDISFLMDTKKYIIRKATDVLFMQALIENLDAGEVEAIALAKELRADLLLIGEKLRKQFAEQEHIACKGVVGVLIAAKHKGLIPLLKPLPDDLIRNLQFRLSDHIYQLALYKANELP